MPRTLFDIVSSALPEGDVTDFRPRFRMSGKVSNRGPLARGHVHTYKPVKRILCHRSLVGPVATSVVDSIDCSAALAA